MEWLMKILEGLPEEKAGEIVEKVKGELPKSFVPKDRYNELAESKRTLEKKQAEEADGRLFGVAVSSALRAAASELKIKDVDLVKMLIDRDGMSVSPDGEVTGLYEQLESIKKDRPYLFGGDTLAGRTPLANAADAPPVTKEQFGAMGYRERMRLFDEQPEVYRSMMGD